ncbi:LysR family transcriptional regulator [Variovorax sp.]|uniref:LysR family transcriptional regulator n=1 Tax=Variovorax sp. TaxID=1871043 RepID=UPI003BAC3622
MNLRQITYFLKIAQLRSFTHAANALYVSQPALSKQMRLLEEELGTALFIRSDRGVKLTEAGELLHARAPHVLEEIASLRNDLQACATQEPSGPLMVGMGISARDIVTVPVVSRYLQRYPRVSLHVREGITGPLVEDVKLGSLDCALLFEVDADEPLIAEPYVREPLLYVGPRTSDLSMERPVSIAQALAQPLATTGGNSPLRRRIDRAAADIDTSTPVAFEVNDVAIMLGCISLNGLHAVVPYSSVHSALAEGRVRAAPIDGLWIDWSFVYARNFGLSLAARAFRSLVFEAAAHLVAIGEWKFCSLLYPQPDQP